MSKSIYIFILCFICHHSFSQSRSGNSLDCDIKAESIDRLSGKYYAFKQDGLWGLTDTDCTIRISAKYQALSSVSTNTFMAKQDDAYGILTANDEWLIPAKYEGIDSYSNGEALVKHNGKWTYVDTLGKEIKKDRHYFKKPDLKALFDICEEASTPEADEKCGERRLLEYIYKHLKYPGAARKNKTEGTVVIQFVISPEGEAMDAKIARDIGDGCGDAALALIDGMPQWYPAEKDGKNVWSYYTLPVRFKLDHKKAKKTSRF